MSRVLPILFNTEMVQAILDSRKTVTRRILKLPKHIKKQEWNGLYTLFAEGECYENQYLENIVDYIKKQCEPGDILYVRETWRVGAWDIQNQMIAFDYKDETCGQLIYINDRELFERIVNQSREDARKAKCEYNGADFVWDKGNSPCRWHPSIHMPKEAARIWLKVTDVRVERLQDITEEQAIKEGISKLFSNMSDAEYKKWAEIFHKSKADYGYKNYLWHGNFGECGTGNKLSDAWEYQYSSYDSAIGSFSSLWNTTVPIKEWGIYGWEANPWVWVIEFERCEFEIVI